MIRLRLPELAKAKGINHAFTALVKAGIARNIVTKYLKGTKTRIEQEHIPIMCAVFRCTPNDLWEITPDDPNNYDRTQPMYRLGPRQGIDILKTLDGLSPDTIVRLVQWVEEEKKRQDGEGTKPE